MSIPFEELDGSPTISMSYRKGTAQRKVLVSWSDAPLMFDALFPVDPYTGAVGYTSFPGYPWLLCSNAKMRPFDPYGMDYNPNALVNSYTTGGAVFELEYTLLGEYGQQQSGPHGDKSGPGGNDGSSSGQNVSFLSHSIHTGGELLALPNNALAWWSDGQKPSLNVRAGITVCTQSHKVTWSYCAWPPWSAIRGLLGHVNKAKFVDAPPGTVLFLGCEASRDYSVQNSSPWWKIGYSFSEKQQTGGLGIAGNCSSAPIKDGWNYYLRPDKSYWDLLTYGAGNSLSATLATIANAGAGYAIGDTITLTGGTFSVATVLTVTLTDPGGVITGVSISAGGTYTAAPGNPVAQGSTSGAGGNATFTMQYSAGRGALPFPLGDFNSLFIQGTALT